MSHTFIPRGAAKKVFKCRDDEVLLSGPAGTGKSRACLEKLHMMALLNPGMRGLIVRKTKASLGSTALVTWNKFIADEAQLYGILRFFGGSAQIPPQYQYSNGSTIDIGGMDKSSKIMSSEYDVIYVQEATELTLNDWEALTSRLRNGRISFQQIIADCNPDAPTHWLKQRCDAGITHILESRHTDNPTLFDDAGNVTTSGKSYVDKLRALSGVRYQRLYLGQWAAAEGLIYDEWDNAVHLIDSLDVSDDWTRWWAVDFGYNNPFVCQHWAEDPDGKLYLYREFYMTQKTVDEHARDILDVVTNSDGTWIEPQPNAIICDHDAENRRRFEMSLGLSTTPAYKSVLDGIEAVQERIRDRRLFIKRDALVSCDEALADAKKPTCTAEEITGYVWKKNLDGSAVKEAPLKENDHGADAMRYMVAELDLSSRPSIRWL